ncbi:MAG: metallophosphoesterase [Oligoflexia bacterium]|nr:metallophosphoesterase [Oligoflexia bacterium]
MNKSISTQLLFLMMMFMMMFTSCGKKFKEVGDFKHPDDFYMVIMSDPQLYWMCEDSSTGCADVAKNAQNSPNASEEQQGDLSNKWQVQSINSLIDKYGESFYSVIINGDLTAYGHESQFNAYYGYYESMLKRVVYPGLGNHDYENNANDTYENHAALRMVKYIRDKSKVLKLKSFDFKEGGVYYNFPSNHKEYRGSMSYSWEVGKVHFVQLHNYSGYEKTIEGWDFAEALKFHIYITNSYEWLDKDLAEATKMNKNIILNVHDFQKTYDEKFHKILQKYHSNVKAIYTGHLHGRHGVFYHIQNIPVYYTGASSVNSYMLLHFLNGELDDSNLIRSSYGAVKKESYSATSSQVLE